jgi:hypothetical protein
MSEIFLCSAAVSTASVVRVLGYGYRGPGSIPGATIFFERQWVWDKVHSSS